MIEDRGLLAGADRAAVPAIDANGIACPAPIPEGERVILGHGSGGQLSASLMRDVIGPALAAAAPGGPLNDAAIVEVAGCASPSPRTLSS